MCRGIFLCLLLSVVQGILAKNHDTDANDSLLEKIMKVNGVDNNCDILLLPQDDEECHNTGEEAKQDWPCHLEFGSEVLSFVEVSNSVRWNLNRLPCSILFFYLARQPKEIFK